MAHRGPSLLATTRAFSVFSYHTSFVYLWNDTTKLGSRRCAERLTGASTGTLTCPMPLPTYFRWSCLQPPVSSRAYLGLCIVAARSTTFSKCLQHGPCTVHYPARLPHLLSFRNAEARKKQKGVLLRLPHLLPAQEGGLQAYLLCACGLQDNISTWCRCTGFRIQQPCEEPQTKPV